MLVVLYKGGCRGGPASDTEEVASQEGSHMFSIYTGDRRTQELTFPQSWTLGNLEGAGYHTSQGDHLGVWGTPFVGGFSHQREKHP